jgi:hypothetical protein
MSRPPHPPRLYNSNYTWRRVQIMKLLVMQLKLVTEQLTEPRFSGATTTIICYPDRNYISACDYAVYRFKEHAVGRCSCFGTTLPDSWRTPAVPLQFHYVRLLNQTDALCYGNSPTECLQHEQAFVLGIWGILYALWSAINGWLKVDEPGRRSLTQRLNAIIRMNLVTLRCFGTTGQL